MLSAQRYKESNAKRTTGKVSVTRLCRLLFFGCFFVAIFIANTIWENEASWLGYYHESLIKTFPKQSEFMVSNFWIILKQRLPIWVFSLILGRSFIGVVGSELFCAWQGFLMGILLAALMIRNGIMGVVFYGMLILPQALLYIVSFVLLYKMNFAIWRGKQQSIYIAFSKKQIMFYIGTTLLFLAGIFSESYVNVFFLEKMTYIFKIF